MITDPFHSDEPIQGDIRQAAAELVTRAREGDPEGKIAAVVVGTLLLGSGLGAVALATRAVRAVRPVASIAAKPLPSVVQDLRQADQVVGKMRYSTTTLANGQAECTVYEIRAWDAFFASVPENGVSTATTGLLAQSLRTLKESARSVSRESHFILRYDMGHAPARVHSILQRRFDALPLQIVPDVHLGRRVMQRFLVPVQGAVLASVPLSSLSAVPCTDPLVRTCAALDAKVEQLRVNSAPTALGSRRKPSPARPSSSARAVPAPAGRERLEAARAVPSAPTALQRRLMEPPRISGEIHTAVVTQQTGLFEATPQNCFRNPAGSITFVDPQTGQHSVPSGTPPPALVAQLQPLPRIMTREDHEAYAAQHGLRIKSFTPGFFPGGQALVIYH
jgi:hypothetical protein